MGLPIVNRLPCRIFIFVFIFVNRRYRLFTFPLLLIRAGNPRLAALIENFHSRKLAMSKFTLRMRLRKLVAGVIKCRVPRFGGFTHGSFGKCLSFIEMFVWGSSRVLRMRWRKLVAGVIKCRVGMNGVFTHGAGCAFLIA